MVSETFGDNDQADSRRGCHVSNVRRRRLCFGVPRHGFEGQSDVTGDDRVLQTGVNAQGFALRGQPADRSKRPSPGRRPQGWLSLAERDERMLNLLECGALRDCGPGSGSRDVTLRYAERLRGRALLADAPDAFLDVARGSARARP